MAFGTNTVFDALEASTLSVQDFGYDNAFDAINDLFTTQNRLVTEQFDAFGEVTTDSMRSAASPDAMTTQELDEVGTPNPQTIAAGGNIGFPLRKFGAAWQGTDDYLENATAKELAAQAVAAATADLRRVQERIRSAFYRATNYDFKDRFVARNKQYTLPVKALANADGFALPIDPNGNVINASTHSHLLATVGASPAQSDYDRLIDTVMEHFNSGTPILAINSAQEATVRAFVTPAFAPDVDARIIQANSLTYTTRALDITNPYNRRIGIYRGAEVWVKPWVLPGYPVCWQTGQEKPLVMRVRKAGDGSLMGMGLKWESYVHPLHARVWVRYFDIAVWNRVAAAVLDTTHQTTYVVPTIPAA